MKHSVIIIIIIMESDEDGQDGPRHIGSIQTTYATDSPRMFHRNYCNSKF